MQGIYFLQKPNSDVKIGFSQDIDRRKKQLEYEHKCTLDLLAYIPVLKENDLRGTENYCHRMARVGRVKGEWHELDSAEAVLLIWSNFIGSVNLVNIHLENKYDKQKAKERLFAWRVYKSNNLSKGDILKNYRDRKYTKPFLDSHVRYEYQKAGFITPHWVAGEVAYDEIRPTSINNVAYYSNIYGRAMYTCFEYMIIEAEDKIIKVPNLDKWPDWYRWIKYDRVITSGIMYPVENEIWQYELKPRMGENRVHCGGAGISKSHFAGWAPCKYEQFGADEIVVNPFVKTDRGFEIAS